MPRPSGISTSANLQTRHRRGTAALRDVHQEVRDNLIRHLRAGEATLPRHRRHDDTVVPQLVNALLSQHNFILLGLRGQAKNASAFALSSRCWTTKFRLCPAARLNDDPLAPIAAHCARVCRRRREGPIAWLSRDARYWKSSRRRTSPLPTWSATRPLKAAKAGLQLSSDATLRIPGACHGLNRRAGSSRSTSCRIWPARSRSGSSTPAGGRCPD